MNEIFVLCGFCTEEAGVMRGDPDFRCQHCKRNNSMVWETDETENGPVLRLIKTVVEVEGNE